MASVDLADSLVPQAHAQRADARPEGFYDSAGHACLVRRAWARRDDDLIGLHGFDVRQRHRVIAPHLHLCPQFRQVLVKVVGEAIVVIDE